MLFNSLVALTILATPTAKLKTENVIFVMTDGLRHQEVFTGAEQALMEPIKSEAFTKRYWRDSATDRRSVLMPFVWGTIATQGQLYGSRDQGSNCMVTNTRNFSYPGYNETLTGAPDIRIDSNAPKPNVNVTVLEWLNGQSGIKGKVAAFGSWLNIGAILNRDRCGFPVSVGYEPFEGLKGNKVIEGINLVKADVTRGFGEDECYDTLTFNTAFEYLKVKKPRMLYIELIETDAWGHSNKYDNYLDAAARVDSYLAKLWKYVESTPQYRGKTSLVVTCDHGRGDGKQWTSHGAAIKGSENTWMMFLGPDTPPLGERKNVPQITNGQAAATIAKLLGFDYNAAYPKAAAPVTDAVN